ncbi:MAG: ArnT family glycosyltransferase [Ignavibacteria bacterium]
MKFNIHSKLLQLIFIIILTGVYIAVYLNLYNLLVFLSPDGNIQQHLYASVKKLVILSYIAILCVILLLKIRSVVKSIGESLYNIVVHKITPALDFEFSSSMRNFITVLLFVYIITASLIIVFTMDVNSDEATYLYTIKHYFEQGKFLYKSYYDMNIVHYDLLGQNLIAVLLKPITKYSIYLPRLITLGYSLGFVVLMFLYLKRVFSHTTANMFLILCGSYPGFIYLSGTAFGENIALFYFFVSMYFLHRYITERGKKFLLIAGIAGALGLVTKMQFAYFFVISMFVILVWYYIRSKEYKRLLWYLFYIFVFVAIIWVIYALLQYNPQEIKKFLAKFYSFGSASVSSSETFMTVLINIERFLNFQMVFLLAVVISGIKYWKREFLTSFIFVFITLNAFWYIFLKGHSFRFSYFVYMGIMYLAVLQITRVWKENGFKLKPFIVIFLMLMFIVGFVQNYKLTKNGVGNNYQMYLTGNNPFTVYETYQKNNDQKIFYEEIKNIVGPEEEIIFIGVENEIMLFLPNRFIWIDPNDSDFSKYSGKFVVKPATNSQLNINTEYNNFLYNYCDLVYKQGLYELYKVK